MKTLTVKKIAQVAFKNGTTSNNLLTFLKGFKKVERDFYLANKIAISKQLSALISADEIKKEKAALLKTAKAIKLPVNKLVKFQAKANAIAKCFNAGYSMGGVIRVILKNGKDNTLIVGKYDNREEYANSCKFSAKHSEHNITLSVKELEQIEIIGGIPTLKIENKKISKCFIWQGVGHKSNYTIDKVENFITGNYHSWYYSKCEEWRTARAKTLLQNRIDAKSIEEKIQAASKKFVGLQHSIDAGNCMAGTIAFAQRHNLEPKYGYNLGYLLNIEPNNSFLLRML